MEFTEQSLNHPSGEEDLWKGQWQKNKVSWNQTTQNRTRSDSDFDIVFTQLWFSSAPYKFLAMIRGIYSEKLNILTQKLKIKK